MPSHGSSDRLRYAARESVSANALMTGASALSAVTNEPMRPVPLSATSMTRGVPSSDMSIGRLTVGDVTPAENRAPPSPELMRNENPPVNGSS